MLGLGPVELLLVLSISIIIVIIPFVGFFIDKLFGERLWSGIERRIGTDLFRTLLSFQGRITRKQWWLMHLLRNLVCSCLVIFIYGVYGVFGDIFVRLIILFSLPILVLYWCSPWALNAKRWHDRDKSTAFIFVEFIPFIGWIWMFIELGCLRGTDGPNRFGPDPLAETQQVEP